MPLSAAEHGTKKLYLDNYQMLECDAKIVDVKKTDDGCTLVLDQTCAFPGGGGQDPDQCRIEWKTGMCVVTEVSKDSDGIITYQGKLEAALPAVGDTAHVVVDPEIRKINSRMHCFGHVIDYALAKLGKDWKAGKSNHRQGACYINYQGEFNAEEAETLARGIEKVLAEYAQKGGAIKPMRVPSKDAHKYSAYLPQAILDSYQNVHLTAYPDNFYVCCGGTHLSDVSELGEVKITKIKKKGKDVRVSYGVE